MLNLELEFNNRLPLFLLYFVVSMAWKPQNKKHENRKKHESTAWKLTKKHELKQITKASFETEKISKI